MLTAHDISAIYGLTVNTVRKMFQQRNPKVPTPCAERPYRVRKDDCKRHWDRLAC